MFDSDEQVESIVFQVLAHPMRRIILKIIANGSDGVSYTDLITELGLSTGKLNYHLEQLEGFVTKNEKRHYILTPLGKKALNQLNLIKEEKSSDDEKYVRIAEASQKSSIQPALKSFLLVGVAFSCVILAIWIYLTYLFILEGAPIIVFVIMPVLIAAGIGLLGSLIWALKKTPDWLRRLEHKAMETD
jgi:predicted transcriptional regulator